MKKRIGIITLNGYKNFGNRLQNYALQKVLEDLGIESETLLTLENNNPIILLKNFLRTIFYLLPFFKKRHSSNHLFIKYFKTFSKNFIHESKKIYSYNNLVYIEKKFNFFVVGSDQVWNPNYINKNSTFFLGFTKPEKRFSYAASFGVDNIPSEHVNFYKKGLSSFNSLSVRENKAKDLISNLIGVESFVHLDPTLLLGKEEWLKLKVKHLNKPSNYLIIYFIGTISQSQLNEIISFSNIHKLEVLNIGSFNLINTIQCGPSEFIDFIHDSSIIFTDSYHAVIFSIIFKKPFIVYQRNTLGLPSMNSRIDTLLDKFNFDNRRFNKSLDFNSCLLIDYSNVDSIISLDSKIAIDYLKKCFNIDIR